jgi:hypothetical protein
LIKDSQIRAAKRRSIEAIVPHKQSNNNHYDGCLQSFLMFPTNFAERELTGDAIASFQKVPTPIATLARARWPHAIR